LVASRSVEPGIDFDIIVVLLKSPNVVVEITIEDVIEVTFFSLGSTYSLFPGCFLS
jgi:hypothetical protein